MESTLLNYEKYRDGKICMVCSKRIRFFQRIHKSEEKNKTTNTKTHKKCMELVEKIFQKDFEKTLISLRDNP